MGIFELLAGAGIVVVVLVIVLVRALAVHAQRTLDALHRALDQDAPPTQTSQIPAQIEAYVARVLSNTGRLPRQVRLWQSCEMQLAPGAAWVDLDAVQRIAVGVPGFVWQATQRIGPLPKVRVIDSFVAGTGCLSVYLLGALRIVRAEGADIDRSEAMRYLAELPWAPEAMLGNTALRWRVISDQEVEVSLRVPEVSVLFHFDEAGDIREVSATNRPARVSGGRTDLRDWRCRFIEYGSLGGLRLPVRGEAGYIVNGIYTPYWRGTILRRVV